MVDDSDVSLLQQAASSMSTVVVNRLFDGAGSRLRLWSHVDGELGASEEAGC